MFTFCKIIVEIANKNFDFSPKNIDKKKKKWYNKRDGFSSNAIWLRRKALPWGDAVKCRKRQGTERGHIKVLL